MKVSLDEIRQVFSDLIQEKKSREEIASWALSRQDANDDDNLEFEPIFEKKKIWKAIGYLTGVDLLDFDGSYLHSVENFVEFRKKLSL
ncbi:MAG: hypothetical protein HW387_1313 [Parachlamydiales bacterium]|nr:hypothetical protein [Parachlamydiales bacterium]